MECYVVSRCWWSGIAVPDQRSKCAGFRLEYVVPIFLGLEKTRANTGILFIVGILCVLGGPIANRIGMNWTLLLGAIGYPIYS